MANVWIVHDNPNAPKNFITAEEYGTLNVLYDGHISQALLPRAVSQARDKVRGVKRGDWLVLTGHPLLISHVYHSIMDKNGVVNVLLWDKQAQRYMPIREVR